LGTSDIWNNRRLHLRVFGDCHGKNHSARLGIWIVAFSTAAAFFFFVAALPFLVSYFFNIDRVSASRSRTALLGFSLAVGSIVVDFGTFAAFRSDYWPAILAFLYFGEVAAFILLGRLIFGNGSSGN
jgi:hypothetical protein